MQFVLITANVFGDQVKLLWIAQVQSFKISFIFDFNILFGESKDLYKEKYFVFRSYDFNFS